MVVTCVRNTSGYLKVWDHLFEGKEAFSNIRMFEIEGPYLKKLRHICGVMVPVLLHPSLYRTVKFIYPTDVVGIVLEGRITSELGTGSVGQSVEVITSGNFRPVCE